LNHATAVTTHCSALLYLTMPNNYTRTNSSHYV